MDAMYTLDPKEIALAGGGHLMKIHHGSLLNACSRLYPSHDWIEWMLQSAVPEGFWETQENQKRYFEWLFRKLELKNMEDWYDVTVADVRANRGSGLLANYHSNTLSLALEACFPDHPWSNLKFRRASLSNAVA